MEIAHFQIGKLGLTHGVIESLKLYFKTHKIVKVSFLKGSLRGGKEKIKEMANEIVFKLGQNYNYKIIGFTIIVSRYGKKQQRQTL